MKTDPAMWITSDFGRMKVPVESNNDTFMEKLTVNKPVAIGYNTVRNSYFDNLILEKDDYNK